MKSILVSLILMSSTANSQNKCLNVLETKKIADIIKERDEVKLNLESTERYFNECKARECSNEWWQDPASIASFTTTAFVLGLLVGIRR
jgi:hypothetical protein